MLHVSKHTTAKQATGCRPTPEGWTVCHPMQIIDDRTYNSGALVRHTITGRYALWCFRVLHSVDQREAAALDQTR